MLASKTRKLLALLLSLTMCVSLLGTAALAADPNAEPICGKEEHTHSDACYERALACGKEESEGHVHGDACYTLACGQEESTGHTHTDACYEAEELICRQRESEGHVHGDACYTLTCGQEEVESHTHSDACYTRGVLTCTQTEHTHDAGCYAEEGSGDPAPEHVAEVDGVPYESLDAAIAAANNGGDKTIVVLNDCSLAGTVELRAPMNITCDSDNPVTITLTGSDAYGFRIGKGSGGNYSFSNLVIQTDTLLSCISIQAYDPTNPVNVSISNCSITNTKKTAIDFEGTTYPGPDTNYFDLTVNNCSITAATYAIGCGSDNNSPNVGSSSLTVKDSTLTLLQNGVYGIHTPKALLSLTIDGNTFITAASGGIKYVYTSDNTVSITNNDFTQCRTSDSSYSIMCTNQITDSSDPRSYQWATELSGNDLTGANTIIAVGAELEAFWFPDGQAQNDNQLNNLGQSNTTDAGTRYGKSNYGQSQLFKISGVSLTDFHIVSDSLAFTVGDSAQNTSYYYNTETSSGAYTNAKPDFSDYWTEENPRHCSASLATWEEANAITRWTFGQDSLDILSSDENGLITAEDDVAKVEVNPATGEITVTPKAAGTTYLNAYVGSGTDETGTKIGSIPNAKSDTLVITVSSPSTPVIPPITPVDPTPTPDPDPDPSEPTEEIPDEDVPQGELPEQPEQPGDPGTQPENPEETVIDEEEPPMADAPETGDNLALWVTAASLSGLGLIALVVTGRKRKEQEK